MPKLLTHIRSVVHDNIMPRVDNTNIPLFVLVNSVVDRQGSHDDQQGNAWG